MTPLRVALLGSPRVERDGAPITFDTRKATALLAYLAVTGHPQGRDTIAGLLWPDHPQAQARGALRRTLSVLNSATGGDVVVADRVTLAVRADRLWLDVEVFRGLASAPVPGRLADLETAESLYRDDFLAGFALRDSPEFDDWQAYQAHGLRHQLAGVLERLARARVRGGDLAGAIGSARRWLAVDPLHEPAHAMLMRLYAWTDQRSSAVRQYRDCVRVLHRELGVAPLSQTTALDAAIRSGRLPRPRAAERPPPGPAPPPRPDDTPFLGRSEELTRVAAAGSAVGATGHVLVLTGEAGIGKSRLLEELLGSVGGDGRRVATARCREGEEGLAYGVVTDLLRATVRADADVLTRLPAAWRAEVARLVPDLAPASDAPAPEAVDSPGARARFYSGLVAALAGEHPAPTLVVEDVQWADESSAELLAYLVRRLGEVPLLLVLTWRPSALVRSSPVRNALAGALGDGDATVVELGPLTLAGVAELASAVLPSTSVAPDVAARLWRETGGVPLYVLEYLQAFDREGRVPTGEEWELPGGVRDLLRARLGGLSETTEQVLSAAAVLTAGIDPTMLRATSGRGEEEMVAALEEALARGVLVESDGPEAGYEFGHDAMRRLVYDSTSLARRRLLHGRAADALALHRDADAGAAGIATHLRRAGRDLESATWFWRAAVRARGLYAHAEALEHLRAAAALGHPGHLVHQVTGDVLTALGRYRDALLAYEQAAASCAPDDTLAIALLERRLAELHHRWGDYDVAESHLAASLQLLTDHDAPDLRARVLADLALVAHRRGDATAAMATAARALTTADAAQDDAALAQVHDVLGVLAAERRDFEAAEQHLTASLEHADRLADPGHRVATLNNLALLHAAAGRADEAVTVAREALRLGLEQGDRHRVAALHTNLADLLHASGAEQEALEHLRAAAGLFAGVDDEEVRRPEIWKLASW